MYARARMAALIAVTEERFHIEPGALVAQDRSQPLVSFRKLAMLVAADMAFSHTAIGRVFERDRSTVTHDIRLAREMLNKGNLWWLNAKADLVDAWNERPD